MTLAVYIYSTVKENYRPHDRSNDRICGFQGSECWRKTTSAPGGINNFCIRGTRGRPLRIRLKRGSNRYSTENISCFTLLWLKIATRRRDLFSSRQVAAPASASYATQSDLPEYHPTASPALFTKTLSRLFLFLYVSTGTFRIFPRKYLFSMCIHRETQSL